MQYRESNIFSYVNSVNSTLALHMQFTKKLSSCTTWVSNLKVHYSVSYSYFSFHLPAIQLFILTWEKNCEHIHAFFYKQRFFSTQPRCCLTFSRIELQMLLRCCLLRITICTETHFMFSIFVSMSRPTSINVVSL